MFIKNRFISPFSADDGISVPLKNGTEIQCRPIRGGDEANLRRFFLNLSQESIFFRFGQPRIDILHDDLVGLYRMNHNRDAVFLAVNKGDVEIIVGEARLNRFSDQETAELSFVVADQWQGLGVGNHLMKYCLVAAKNMGLRTLLMEVMKRNDRMMQLGYKYDFQPLPCNNESDMEELQLIIRDVGGSLDPFRPHPGLIGQSECMSLSNEP